MTTKILFSLLAISAVSVIAVGATTSYFSDTETSVGNVFTAGTLNLKVGEYDPTTWNFVIPDIKPGDSDSEEAVLENTGTTNGYLHITFDNRVNDEMECVEPEENDPSNPDHTCGDPGDLIGEDLGELAENLGMLIYIDEDNDNAFVLGADTLIYQGKLKGILQGSEFNYVLASAEQCDFRVEWSLDYSVGNIVQSDKAGFDIVFELTQTQKDIVGDWHFNEDAFGILTSYDSSGQDNRGTLMNGADWGDGKYNSAMSFDQVSNDYVDCGNDTTLDLTNTDDFTLELWAKKDSNPTGGNYNVMGLAGKNLLYAIDYHFVPNLLRAGVRGTNNQYFITTDAPNELLDWTHVVFIYESEKTDGMKLYVNSDLKSFKTTFGLSDFSDADKHFEISGPATGGNITKFDGLIDEVKLYNRALSDTEISEHYQAGI